MRSARLTNMTKGQTMNAMTKAFLTMDRETILDSIVGVDDRALLARMQAAALQAGILKFRSLDGVRDGLREIVRGRRDEARAAEYRFNDPLAQRQREAAQVYADALPDGTVYLYEWGRDCDHCESDSVRRVTAAPMVIERRRERMYDDAEGPCVMYTITAEQAAEYEPTRRDHVLEAFEDGHPHSVAL